MATKSWIGNQVARPYGITFAIIDELGEEVTIKITIGTRVVSVTATSGTAGTAVAAALAAAAAASFYPEFREITWTANGVNVLGTGNTPGKQFICSVDSTGNAPFGTRTLTGTSPNDFSDPANWSTGAVPASGDEVYFENGSVDCLYNLAQSSITLSSLNIAATYTGNIGLPQYTGKYQDYRPTFLAISATTVSIGYGPGSGSPKIRLDTGSSTASVIVSNTGSSNEAGLEAFCWRNAATSTIEILRGSVGIAALSTDVASLSTLRIGYVTNMLGDANVRCGGGCANTTVVVDGGNTLLARGNTISSGTITQNGGSLTVDGTTACGQFSVNSGTLYWNSTGTLGASANSIGGSGTLDFSQDMQTKIIATGAVINCAKGATINDPHNAIVAASGKVTIAPQGCSVDALNLNFGIGRLVQV